MRAKISADDMLQRLQDVRSNFFLPFIVSFDLNIVAEPLDNSFLIHNLNFKHCSSLLIHYCLFWKALFKPVGEF